MTPFRTVLAALLLAAAQSAGRSNPAVTAAIRAHIDEANRGSEAALARRADRALGDGHIYLALHVVEPAWVRQSAERFVREHEKVRTPDGFRAEWNRVRATLPDRAPARAQPLLLTALHDAARARCEPTLNGSLPYFEEIDARDGLYYLGEARALAQLAAFYAELPMSPAGTTPALRSLAPEIGELYANVAAMHRTADERSRTAFVPISTSLRLASLLNDEHAYAGALLELLLARYQAALLVTPVAAADGARERLARVSRTLDDGRDHSIAALFMQMAALHLSGALPPGPRGAAAIADEVLPAYLTIIGGRP
ncbi:MAG TPA: hypothetical protein VFK20_10380 [Vicinamibacterales bacterium]|nr:hypothetical protein [Vicinamibacterales bacterium]